MAFLSSFILFFLNTDKLRNNRRVISAGKDLMLGPDGAGMGEVGDPVLGSQEKDLPSLKAATRATSDLLGSIFDFRIPFLLGFAFRP